MELRWRSGVVIAVIVVIKFVSTDDVQFDPRIINGQIATYQNTKHQVSIRLKSRESRFGRGHICGGSLIGSRKVLTAAHCVYDAVGRKFRKPKEFSVVMGTLNLFKKPNGTIVSDVSSLAIYKTFNTNTLQHDIALLFLKKGLPPNTTHLTVQPITLNNLSLPAGTLCQVSGWGATQKTFQSVELSDDLRIANVTIIDRNRCSVSYMNKIKSGMLCAGYMMGGTDACQGDSGGPLVHNGTLVGIVSWGSGCGLKGFPGVYTDVRHYVNWITKTNASGKLCLELSLVVLSFMLVIVHESLFMSKIRFAT